MDNEVTEPSLPIKSIKRYTEVYEKFVKWRQENDKPSLDESVMMIYFNELSKIMKPSSLWSIYSMLKSTLKCQNNEDISGYSKLISFLKQQSRGYVAVKSKTLTLSQIEKFITEAPDQYYLVKKVILILGVSGACRKEDLCYLTVDDVEDLGTKAIVKLPKTEGKIQKIFIITDEYYPILKRYMQCRPPRCPCNRFFLKYRQGICYKQPIGIHQFGKVGQQIARYLNLPDPDRYTGATFRKTSAALLAGIRSGRTLRKIPSIFKPTSNTSPSISSLSDSESEEEEAPNKRLKTDETSDVVESSIHGPINQRVTHSLLTNTTYSPCNWINISMSNCSNVSFYTIN